MITALLRSGFVVVTLAATHSVTAAPVIDAWDFTYADGTELSQALSNNGTALGNNSAGLVSVQSNALQFSSTNTDGSSSNLSSFRTANLSVDPITSGQIEVSWAYTSASMTATDAADGSGRAGFFLRDNDPSNADHGVRIEYNGTANEFRLQYTDDNANNSTLTTFSGNTLSDLVIRYVVDLDNAGTAGSFRAFYSLGGAPEVTAVSDGVFLAGGQIDQFRTVQQVTNGGTDWRQGDTIVVDDLKVEVVPEPSSLALAGLGTLLCFRRRAC